VVTFVLLKLVGDPLAYLTEDPRISEEDRFRRRALAGLNDPIPLQFVHWLIGDDWFQRDITGDGVPDVYGERLGILRGDFGESLRLNRPAQDVLLQKLPNTLLLGLTAYIVTVIVALVVGIFAALRQYSLADNVITAATFVMFAVPTYLVALFSVYVFAVQFRLAGLPYLPVQGMYDPRGDGSLGDLLWHMILPVFCLSSVNIAGYSRFIRASMLETINSDYVRTARSKGLPNSRVVYIHALKNASLPLVTLMGLDIPFILSGAVITEQIFSWDGMGLLFVNSLGALDAPVLVMFTLMTAIAVVILQLVADIVYAWLDPRVRYG
jgi:peptide/nickel transport system permease protein